MGNINAETPHHVVVVGGGFAGLQCIKALNRSGVKITLIDQCNHHLFQPLLYQAATTILAPSQIAWPLRRLLRHRKDVTTILATVVEVEAEDKHVLLEDGMKVRYDTLVLATGARHSYFGRPEWEQFAPGLKTLEDATAIRQSILAAFEMAEKVDDPELQRACLTFAVIGAGPTGVELAGIIAELAHRVLPGEFRRIDTRTARILLIEAGDKVLSAFPDKLSDYASDALAKLGIEVMLGKPVTECREGGIEIDGQAIACQSVIWAAGVQASAAANWVNAESDRAGRALVSPDLTVPGYADVFVVGDTAAVKDSKGNPVPGIAPAAKQMGNHVGKAIRQRLSGVTTIKAFEYRHAGSLATLGRRAAIADFGFFKLKGPMAWWTWGFAHIWFLIGNRSRIAVAWSWLWSYFTGQNAARLITRPNACERAAAKKPTAF